MLLFCQQMAIFTSMAERNAYSQLRRVTAILRMLCFARGPLPIDGMIRKLPEYGVEPCVPGQDPRTIKRDIAFLRNGMGYHIDTIRGQGYFLQASNEVLPLTFTKEELQALCLGQELFSPFEGTHFGDAIEQVYKKISRIYQKNVNVENEKIQRLENAFLIHTGPIRRYDSKKEIIKKLFDAILEQTEIELRYPFDDNLTGAILLVQPHKLIIYKESFYLLGIHKGKSSSGFRTYLIDRIIDVTVTDRKFKPKNTSNYEKDLDDSFGILVYGEKKTVRILFDNGIAKYLQERVWHPSQKFKQLRNGLQMEMDILVNEEVAAWLKGFGAAVKKVEPKELRKMVQDNTNK